MPSKSQDMSLLLLIKTTAVIVRGALALAKFIRDSENIKSELKDAAKFLSNDLVATEDLLDNLMNFAQRVSDQDEKSLCKKIELLSSTVNDAEIVLKDVGRDRNLLQSLFMRKDHYRRKLRETSTHLNDLCGNIQGSLQTMNRIEVPREELLELRSRFQNKPDKDITFYDFMTIRNPFNSVISINFDDFDREKDLCHMKLRNERIYFSHQLRIWSALHIKPITVEQHQSKCEEEIHSLYNSHSTDNYPVVELGWSTPLNTLSDEECDIHKNLDFIEICMSHDYICGMALAQSMIYVATKCEIKVFSLIKQKFIAQYGIENDGSYSFNHISYIYVPPNDETNLYIVDGGQNVIHQYKINDSGLCFEFVHLYIVIANVNQKCKLISCTIFNQNLCVSDESNNCLHIFRLNGDRQLRYLADTSMVPFSPGSLCSHGKYLYVGNSSKENSGILVLNEECQPVDWFRNRSLTEILAIDIDPNTNELYVLTTMKKRPAIVSMNLIR